MALLGELKSTSGSVQVNGSISYAAQTPWVFTSTIRQNILFGQEYDPDRYAEILEATDLVEVKITTKISSYISFKMEYIEWGLLLSVGSEPVTPR